MLHLLLSTKQHSAQQHLWFWRCVDHTGNAAPIRYQVRTHYQLPILSGAQQEGAPQQTQASPSGPAAWAVRLGAVKASSSQGLTG